jgi:hypothetical protein
MTALWSSSPFRAPYRFGLSLTILTRRFSEPGVPLIVGPFIETRWIRAAHLPPPARSANAASRGIKRRLPILIVANLPLAMRL